MQDEFIGSKPTGHRQIDVINPFSSQLPCNLYMLVGCTQTAILNNIFHFIKDILTSYRQLVGQHPDKDRK